MDKQQGTGLSASEVADERAQELPNRELMTLITPSAGGSVLPGLTGADPTGADATGGEGATPTADTATTTAGATAADASHFTPPPSDGAYSPTATSTSTS